LLKLRYKGLWKQSCYHRRKRASFDMITSQPAFHSALENRKGKLEIPTVRSTITTIRDLLGHKVDLHILRRPLSLATAEQSVSFCLRIGCCWFSHFVCHGATAFASSVRRFMPASTVLSRSLWC